MCKPKPYPRCASHAKSALAQAMQSGDAESIKQATDDYFRTASGIKQLKERGDLDLARRYQKERKELIAQARNVTENTPASSQITAEVSNAPSDPEMIRMMEKVADQKALEDMDTTSDQLHDILRRSRNDSPDARTYVLSEVASHPNTSTRLLDILYSNDRESFSVTERLSSNPNLSPQYLDELARHADDRIRQNVAHNPSSPTLAVAVLSLDKYAGVAEVAIRHPNATPSLLAFAMELRPGLRRGVASNPNASAENLIQVLESDLASLNRTRTSTRWYERLDDTQMASEHLALREWIGNLPQVAESATFKEWLANNPVD